VTGVGERDLSGAPVADTDHGGRHVPVGGDVELVGALREGCRGAVPVEEVGPDREAGPGHDGHRVDAPAGDVTDDEAEPALVEVDDAVPVAADVDSPGAGDVLRRDLQVGDGRVAAGQQCPLKAFGEVALLAVHRLDGLASTSELVAGATRDGGEQQAAEEQDQGEPLAERGAEMLSW
jgi:hypothetical protein